MKEVMFVMLSVMMSSLVNAQGCSDAGFCSIHSLQPNKALAKRHLLKFGANYSKADNAIQANAFYVNYLYQWNKKLVTDIKLTALTQSGNGINTFGMGDVFITSTYNANDKIKLIGGVKLPLNTAARKLNELPLPMDYQSSLGTFDVIMGGGYSNKQLQLQTAIQLPLTQNKNQFLPMLYPSGSALRTWVPTNNFKRSADVLLRVAYLVPVVKYITITPSILPIYHLDNDSYTSSATGKSIAIEGSKGLTINGNLFIDIAISAQHSIQLNMAAPFAVRDVRPDGLTRSFLLGIEYGFRF